MAGYIKARKVPETCGVSMAFIPRAPELLYDVLWPQSAFYLAAFGNSEPLGEGPKYPNMEYRSSLCQEACISSGSKVHQQEVAYGFYVIWLWVYTLYI